MYVCMDGWMDEEHSSSSENETTIVSISVLIPHINKTRNLT